MAEMTNLAQVILPAMFITVAFHLGSLFPIFSIQGIKYDFLASCWRWATLNKHKETPLEGKVGSDPPNSAAPHPHRMGITQLLFRLVISPRASPNLLSIAVAITISSSQGLTKKYDIISVE
jgi:hypothetical protein